MSFAILIFVFCLSRNLHAKYHIFYQTSYITQEFSYTINGSEKVSKETRTPSDIKFGYEMSNNIFLGLIYHSGITTISSSETTTKYKRTGYGPAIGYHMSKYFIHGSYFMSLENDRDNETIFKKGSGFQIDFGWLFKIGSNFSITPELSYRSFSYKERVVGDADPVEVESSADGEIIPQIGVNFSF